jgi:hypothetical protein
MIHILGTSESSCDARKKCLLCSKNIFFAKAVEKNYVMLERCCGETLDAVFSEMTKKTKAQERVLRDFLSAGILTSLGEEREYLYSKFRPHFFKPPLSAVTEPSRLSLLRSRAQSPAAH